MKVICSKESLSEAINVVQKAIASKSTMQILECILIKAEKELTFTASDMDLTIQHKINSNIIEEGTVAISARMFSEIIRKLPDDDVQLTVNENNVLQIECYNSVVELKGLSADGFPDVPTVNSDESISVSQDIIKNMIKQTLFAVGIDEFKPILTGSLLQCDDNKLNMVSIDGMRIAIKNVDVEGIDSTKKAVIPGKTLNEISKILQASDEAMDIVFNNNQIKFNFSGTTIVSKLLEGDFFNYESSIPQTFSTTIKVKVKDILSAVELASTITSSEKRYPVKFDIGNDIMIITSNTEIGNVKEEIEIDMTGDKLEVGFNPRYFLDALKVIEDEMIEICFSSSVGPCIIKPIEGDGYTHLILPLRLKSDY